jgi:hypothetical protein
MKVFITGAGGYVGTALTKELIAHGHTVLGLARSDASAEKLKSLGAEVHRGDLENLDTLRAGALAADGVIHCAFDHSLLGTDYMAAARKDAEAIEAMGEALAGTNKPFINTSGTVLIAGKGTTEDIAGVAEGFAAGHRLSTAAPIFSPQASSERSQRQRASKAFLRTRVTGQPDGLQSMSSMPPYCIGLFLSQALLDDATMLLETRGIVSLTSPPLSVATSNFPSSLYHRKKLCLLLGSLACLWHPVTIILCLRNLLGSGQVGSPRI